MCKDCKHPNCPKCGTTHFVSECIYDGKKIVEKKCPKGNDTHWTCYEVCEHRENGICALNN